MMHHQMTPSQQPIVTWQKCYYYDSKSISVPYGLQIHLCCQRQFVMNLILFIVFVYKCHYIDVMVAVIDALYLGIKYTFSKQFDLFYTNKYENKNNYGKYCDSIKSRPFTMPLLCILRFRFHLCLLMGFPTIIPIKQMKSTEKITTYILCANTILRILTRFQVGNIESSWTCLLPKTKIKGWKNIFYLLVLDLHECVKAQSEYFSVSKTKKNQISTFFFNIQNMVDGFNKSIELFQICFMFHFIMEYFLNCMHHWFWDWMPLPLLIYLISITFFKRKHCLSSAIRNLLQIE